MRCKNAVLFNKIGVPKVDERTEVTFSLMSDLNNCNTVNTRDYSDISFDLYVYNPYDRPDNVFDCDGGVCTNTGSLSVLDIAEDFTGSEIIKYGVPINAEDFYTGVITLYTKGVTDLYISDACTFTNADVYTVGLSGGVDEWSPNVVNLAMNETSSTAGTGWSGEGSVIWLGFKPHNSGTTSDPEYAPFSISSISFFKSIYDLAVGDVVKISCLSEVGGSFDLSALERTCLSQGYDKTSLNGGVDYTVTGKHLTSNYWKLNPLAGFRNDHGDTVGYKIETIKATVSSVVGGDYGSVTVPDMYEGKCDFIGAQVADKCVNPNADTLRRVMSGNVFIYPSIDQFVVVDDKFFFSGALIGQEVLITYPKAVAVDERIEGSEDNIGTVRVKMSYPIKLSDGTVEIHTFNNVLVTSFPTSITNEEGEFSFTINIQRDNNGKWFEIQRISGDIPITCSNPN